MPALPAHVTAAPLPDSSKATVCEVSCRLVDAQDAARTGCTKGLALPGIRIDPACIDQPIAQHVPVIELHRSNGTDLQGKVRQDQQPQALSGASNTILQAVRVQASALLVKLGLPGLLQSAHDLPPLKLIAWHAAQPILAVAHASTGAVLLYAVAQAPSAASRQSGVVDVDCLQEPQQVLTHQLQQQVSSLAWRPVQCSMLATGCMGGVALWSLGRTPLTSPTAAGRSKGASGWVTFLAFNKGCRVTALCWAPDGQRLAGSSADTNAVMVWDVALGVGTKLRLGLEPVTTLAWSPDGNYLFAAARTRRFFLYETATWTVRAWDTAPGASVTGAAWAPDSNAVLLSMSRSSYLVALHLVGQPPNLSEQMLPVAIPGVSDVQEAAGAKAGDCIQSIAWDPAGHRLAVTLAQPHPAAGTLALYSTTFDPVISCHLIGYVQPGTLDSTGDLHTKAANGADQSQGHDGQEGTSNKVQQHKPNGSGSSSADRSVQQLQVAFALAPGKAAAVLSIGHCSADYGTVEMVQNVPMYF